MYIHMQFKIVHGLKSSAVTLIFSPTVNERCSKINQPKKIVLTRYQGLKL